MFNYQNYIRFHVDLAGYSIIQGGIIPKCYGNSFLVKKDKKIYVAQSFAPSSVDDNYDEGMSGFHREIVSMSKLNHIKSVVHFNGFNLNGFDNQNSIILLDYFNSKSLENVIKTKMDFHKEN